MISKTFIAAAVVAVTALAVAPPLAHAGGGMGVNSGMTTCRVVVSGAPKQFQVAAVQDSFLSADTKDTVNIGTLSLLCDLGAVGQTLNPAPGTTGTGAPPATPNSISCYSVGKAAKARIPVAVQDAFTTTFDSGGTYGVELGSIAFVCVPAVFDDTP